MFQKIVCGVAVGLASLALASEVKAGPPPVRRAHPGPSIHRTAPVVKHGSYLHRHGVRYHGGYYYRGRHHSHWAHRVWDSYYRRYHFWCPYALVYYYYSDVDDCYYPIAGY